MEVFSVCGDGGRCCGDGGGDGDGRCCGDGGSSHSDGGGRTVEMKCDSASDRCRSPRSKFVSVDSGCSGGSGGGSSRSRSTRLPHRRSSLSLARARARVLLLLSLGGTTNKGRAANIAARARSLFATAISLALVFAS